MRKLFIAALCIALSVPAFSQKAQVQTAYNYLKYDQLDKAMDAIELAAAHEQSMNMEKTWYYRGQIYQQMYKHEKYSTLVPSPLEEALKSYDRVFSINPKSEYAEDINARKNVIANSLYQSGADKYGAKDFAGALKNFELASAINKSDTTLIYNCAISADKAKMTDKSLEYYNRLRTLNYKDPRVYSSLANIYKSQKDTSNALTVIKDGRTLFPNDVYLIIEELNIYLYSGKNKEAMDALAIAIEKDPQNVNLYFAQGSVYEKLNMPDKSIESYKKAISLKPDFFDANYNLGAIYFNQAAEMANKANDIPPKEMTRYMQAEKEFKEKFRQAQPYLEKAHELNPNDRSTMSSLKQLYVRIGMNDKASEMDAKMK
jgi:tetratricopeptide (TPR) repeat protein